MVLIANRYPWWGRAQFDARPKVGQLMELCEENYRYLHLLAPDLRRMRGQSRSRPQGAMELHLEVLEQTPYTTMLHLTYYFLQQPGVHPDPNVVVRVYHDSRQAEIVGLHQHALPLNTGVELPTLQQKWRVNLFFSKWLAYCYRQGHRFNGGQAALPVCGARAAGVAESC